MFEFQYKKPLITIDGIDFELYLFNKYAESSVSLYLINKEYNWGTTAIANETKINGIVQTSADMIIETLSNG